MKERKLDQREAKRCFAKYGAPDIRKVYDARDKWIRTQIPGAPVLSLDEIRRERMIRPTDSQSAVIQAAREQARSYLRGKQPFVWDATNLTRETRQRVIELLEQYGARVHIVYLETTWENRITRNTGRERVVSENVVGKLLAKTVPPTPREAQSVSWLCV